MSTYEEILRSWSLVAMIREEEAMDITIALVSSFMLLLLAFGRIPERTFGNSVDKANGRWAMELW